MKVKKNKNLILTRCCLKDSLQMYQFSAFLKQTYVQKCMHEVANYDPIVKTYDFKNIKILTAKMNNK